jgi:hypothetical protein
MYCIDDAMNAYLDGYARKIDAEIVAGMQPAESPVVINPETWVRSLPHYRPGATTQAPRARTEKRPMCESCLFGQHELCECESCPCAGEFRDQPRRGTKSLAQQAMRGEV